MSEGSKKKYNTNPLDPDVAKRAEEELDESGTPESEARTREMPPEPGPIPVAGGPTAGVGPPTAYPAPIGTADPRLPYADPPDTRGLYEPPRPFPSPGSFQPIDPMPIQPIAAIPQPVVQPGPLTGSAKLGFKPNFAAMIAYLPFVGIVPAFLLLKNEPAHHRFVRFHAKQALFAHAAFWIAHIVFNMARSNGPLLFNILMAIPQFFFFVASFAGFIFMMRKAYLGEKTKIPILGDQAE